MELETLLVLLNVAVVFAGSCDELLDAISGQYFDAPSLSSFALFNATSTVKRIEFSRDYYKVLSFPRDQKLVGLYISGSNLLHYCDVKCNDDIATVIMPIQHMGRRTQQTYQDRGEFLYRCMNLMKVGEHLALNYKDSTLKHQSCSKVTDCPEVEDLVRSGPLPGKVRLLNFNVTLAKPGEKLQPWVKKQDDDYLDMTNNYTLADYSVNTIVKDRDDSRDRRVCDTIALTLVGNYSLWSPEQMAHGWAKHVAKWLEIGYTQFKTIGTFNRQRIGRGLFMAHNVPFRFKIVHCHSQELWSWVHTRHKPGDPTSDDFYMCLIMRKVGDDVEGTYTEIKIDKYPDDFEVMCNNTLAEKNWKPYPVNYFRFFNLRVTRKETTTPMITTSMEKTTPMITTSMEKTTPMSTTSTKTTTPMSTTRMETTTPNPPQVSRLLDALEGHYFHVSSLQNLAYFKESSEVQRIEFGRDYYRVLSMRTGQSMSGLFISGTKPLRFCRLHADGEILTAIMHVDYMPKKMMESYKSKGLSNYRCLRLMKSGSDLVVDYEDSYFFLVNDLDEQCHKVDKCPNDARIEGWHPSATRLVLLNLNATLAKPGEKLQLNIKKMGNRYLETTTNVYLGNQTVQTRYQAFCAPLLDGVVGRYSLWSVDQMRKGWAQKAPKYVEFGQDYFRSIGTLDRNAIGHGLFLADNIPFRYSRVKCTGDKIWLWVHTKRKKRGGPRDNRYMCIILRKIGEHVEGTYSTTSYELRDFRKMCINTLDVDAFKMRGYPKNYFRLYNLNETCVERAPAVKSNASDNCHVQMRPVLGQYWLIRYPGDFTLSTDSPPQLIEFGPDYYKVIKMNDNQTMTGLFISGMRRLRYCHLQCDDRSALKVIIPIVDRSQKRVMGDNQQRIRRYRCMYLKRTGDDLSVAYKDSDANDMNCSDVTDCPDVSKVETGSPQGLGFRLFDLNTTVAPRGEILQPFIEHTDEGFVDTTSKYLLEDRLVEPRIPDKCATLLEGVRGRYSAWSSREMEEGWAKTVPKWVEIERDYFRTLGTFDRHRLGPGLFLADSVPFRYNEVSCSDSQLWLWIRIGKLPADNGIKGLYMCITLRKLGEDIEGVVNTPIQISEEPKDIKEMCKYDFDPPKLLRLANGYPAYYFRLYDLNVTRDRDVNSHDFLGDPFAVTGVNGECNVTATRIRGVYSTEDNMSDKRRIRFCLGYFTVSGVGGPQQYRNSLFVTDNIQFKYYQMKCNVTSTSVRALVKISENENQTLVRCLVLVANGSNLYGTFTDKQLLSNARDRSCLDPDYVSLQTTPNFFRLRNRTALEAQIGTTTEPPTETSSNTPPTEGTTTTTTAPTSSSVSTIRDMSPTMSTTESTTTTLRTVEITTTKRPMASSCDSTSCLHGGTCIDKPGGKHVCKCTRRFRGSRCQDHFRPCQKMKCRNNGRCHVTGSGRPVCRCAIGFKGATCLQKDPTCGKKCGKHGKCQQEDNVYSCHCDAGYSGLRCRRQIDPCLSAPCRNDGTCQKSASGYRCSCPDGYTGTLCESPVVRKFNPCSKSPCENNSTCVTMGDGSYTCICLPAYFGARCENKVETPHDTTVAVYCNGKSDKQQCGSHGTCEDGVCKCEKGYDGIRCETDVDECAGLPCGEHGTCVDGIAKYTCVCSEGFEGRNCQTEIDECVSGPCQNGGDCVDLIARYECSCNEGFTGRNCETDINDCASQPCENGGLCIDRVAGYRCECAKGYDGRTCRVDIDECASSPCKHGGICRDFIGDYMCKCVDGYGGKMCEGLQDACAKNPCRNQGTCHTEEEGEYFCECPKRYFGKNCETTKLACLSNPCQNGGGCVEQDESFTCTCKLGFTGARCEFEINECSNNPCSDHGICKDGKGQFTCICKQGFTGELCETEIDMCQSQECKNDGRCITESGLARCLCTPGFAGTVCDENINECLSNPCRNGGKCVDGVNNYVCLCSRGFSGRTCSELTRKCMVGTCKNEGTCVENKDGAKCVCKPGFTGATCNVEVNECESYPCRNDGFCLDLVDDYGCKCTAGFYGKNCQSDYNECLSNPCSNNAVKCIDGTNSFNCVCMPGFTGVTCSTDIDDCKDQLCQNDGICLDKANGFICECSGSFTGRLCENRKDPCASNPCTAEQTCMHMQGNFECKCPPNRHGVHCDKEDTLCHSMPCKNGGVCKGSPLEYTCHCQENYNGMNCEIKYCDVNQCGHLSTCVVTHRGHGFKCVCPPGLEGDRCQQTKEPCASSPCTHGNCSEVEGKFECSCDDGYHGVRCDKYYPCLKNVCKHQGTCMKVNQGFKCLCPTGYTGRDCQLVTCDLINCGNNGKCVKIRGTVTCRCNKGFTGKECNVSKDGARHPTTVPDGSRNTTTLPDVKSVSTTSSEYPIRPKITIFGFNLYVAQFLAAMLGAITLFVGVCLVITCCRVRLKQLSIKDRRCTAPSFDLNRKQCPNVKSSERSILTGHAASSSSPSPPKTGTVGVKVTSKGPRVYMSGLSTPPSKAMKTWHNNCEDKEQVLVRPSITARSSLFIDLAEEEERRIIQSNASLPVTVSSKHKTQPASLVKKDAGTRDAHVNDKGEVVRVVYNHEKREKNDEGVVLNEADTSGKRTREALNNLFENRANSKYQVPKTEMDESRVKERDKSKKVHRDSESTKRGVVKNSNNSYQDTVITTRVSSESNVVPLMKNKHSSVVRDMMKFFENRSTGDTPKYPQRNFYVPGESNDAAQEQPVSRTKFGESSAKVITEKNAGFQKWGFEKRKSEQIDAGPPTQEGQPEAHHQKYVQEAPNAKEPELSSSHRGTVLAQQTLIDDTLGTTRLVGDKIHVLGESVEIMPKKKHKTKHGRKQTKHRRSQPHENGNICQKSEGCDNTPQQNAQALELGSKSKADVVNDEIRVDTKLTVMEENEAEKAKKHRRRSSKLVKLLKRVKP